MQIYFFVLNLHYVKPKNYEQLFKSLNLVIFK